MVKYNKKAEKIGGSLLQLLLPVLHSISVEQVSVHIQNLNQKRFNNIILAFTHIDKQ